MTPGGRVAAAIHIIDLWQREHRPVRAILSDWGHSHRYAGSKDRAAIGNLVYDTLRNKSAAARRMDEETPRALVLGTLASAWKLEHTAIAALCDASRYAPDALNAHEHARIKGHGPSLATATADDAVAANIPEWLWPAFVRAFDAQACTEGAALADRAPVDLRVNAIKADRAKVQKSLLRFKPRETPFSPMGLRFDAGTRWQRAANIRPEAALQKGWAVVQDEGSQLAALLCGAAAGQQVLDLCAGSGGKTLALAAIMENRGQVHAFDKDRHRLAAIHDRLKGAGARNVQVLPAGDEVALSGLVGKMDIVFVDAPCTGSGVWRRHPDAKWRLTPAHLARRLQEQHRALASARRYVKPGGVLVYVTCSLLCEENEDQMRAFLQQNDDFSLVSLADRWQNLTGSDNAPVSASIAETVRLSPATTNTDGFFIAALRLKP